jgi:hypothetical protein
MAACYNSGATMEPTSDAPATWDVLPFLRGAIVLALFTAVGPGMCAHCSITSTRLALNAGDPALNAAVL